MKIFIPLLILACALVGCTDPNTPNPNTTQVVANQDPRKQLLDAQFDSILSLREQMSDFYMHNSGTIDQWSVDTKNHYYEMQNRLNRLYDERQQLINQLGGTNVGQAPANPLNSGQAPVNPLSSNQPNN